MELSDQTKIGVTYQANNIGELQSRQGTYTNKFKIPLTRTNIENIEFSHVMTSSSVLPYRILPAIYIDNGVEVITGGSALLEPCDKEFIYVSVTSGNIDFSASIGDMIVGDLYENQLPYLWDIGSVYNYRDASKYFIYPVVNWIEGNETFFDTPSINTNEMLPTARIADMFPLLEQATGFTFKGAYLESEEHLNMILTPDNFTVNPLYLSQDATQTSWGNANAWTSNFDVAEGNSTTLERIFPLTNIFDSGFISNLYTSDINHVGTLSFSANIDVNWLPLENYGSFEQQKKRDYNFVARIVRQSDGVVMAEITYPIQNIKLFHGTINYLVAVQTDSILLPIGESYYCCLDFSADQHDNMPSRIFVRGNTSVFKHTPTDIITVGSPIRFRDIFRMKVKDVLKDVLNLRGIIIQTNGYTKEVQFNLFQDLIKNIPIADDWSEKVDPSFYNLGFKFGDYAQTNWMRFKSNEGVTDELGDYFFTIDDTTLQAEKTVVQINHAATEQSAKYLGYNVPSIDAIDVQTKWQKPGYRILQLDIQNTSFDVTFTDGTTTETTRENIPFARFVGFDELVPDFYNALTGILDRTKALPLMLRLTPIDILELDFSIPKYLNVPQLSIDGYFYLNKVSNYKGGLTACELIRL